MKRMRLLEIVGTESEVKLVVAEVVISVEIFEPRQFELKTAVFALKINYDTRAVVRVYPARLFEPERLAVKIYRTRKSRTL